MKRHFAAFTALALLATLTSGCSSSTAQSGTSASPQSGTAAALPQTGTYEPIQPVKDEARGMLPLDPYWGGPVSDLESQAREAVIVDCMHKAGYADEKPRFDYSAPRSESLVEGSLFRHRFNEDLAAEYGYRWAPDPQDTLTEAEAELFHNKPEEYHNTRDNCWEYADKVVPTRAIPLPPEEEATEKAKIEEELKYIDEQMAAGVENPEPPPSNEPLTISEQMNRGIPFDQKSTDLLEQSATQWRECMEPLGIVDLPDEPSDPRNLVPMDSSLRQRWNIESPADPSASAEEIEYATHDAKCRRSSGWFDNYYEAQWNAEQKFVDEHRDELEPILQRFREVVPQYYEIIAQYSGTQSS